MAKKNEPPFDPQRHGRRIIDALYHRVMAYACAPDTLRRVSRDHDHPGGADDGTELCLTCALYQPSDTPRLDEVLYEAMFDQACIDTDGTLTNPYVIESKLARSSQRKAMKDYFGSLWFVLIPAAYTLTTYTAADIARMASTVPSTFTPSHAARHLGNAAAADITGLPRAVATGSATAQLARMCAVLIEAHTRPVVFTAPRATRTSTQFIRDSYRSRGAKNAPRGTRRTGTNRAGHTTATARGAVHAGATARSAGRVPADRTHVVSAARAGTAKQYPQRAALTAQARAAAQKPATGKDWRAVLFGTLSPSQFVQSLATTPAASAHDELARKKRLIEHTLSGLARQRAELDSKVTELAKQRHDLAAFDTHITGLLDAYNSVLDTLGHSHVDTK